MRNRNPKMVEILNDRDLQFKCKSCGLVWWRYPGNNKIGWQCPNGCKIMNEKLMEKIKKYIKLLINKSKEIKEVYLIGSSMTGKFNKNSDIDLVICFNKDPSSENNLKILETVLKWGNELEKKRKDLKIEYPIDLGFITGTDIFLEFKSINNYDFDAEHKIFTRKEIIK